MRDHHGRVQAGGDRPAADARRCRPGQLPGPPPGGGTGNVDRPQRPHGIRGEGADQAGDHGIGGDRPEQSWLGAQQRRASQAVPAQRHHHRQVQHGLLSCPESWTARGARHRANRPTARNPGPSPALSGSAGRHRRATPAPGRQRTPAGAGAARNSSRESASALRRTGPSTSPILPAQRHFLRQITTPCLTEMRPLGIPR
jgi:hypothetical protein